MINVNNNKDHRITKYIELKKEYCGVPLTFVNKGKVSTVLLRFSSFIGGLHCIDHHCLS